MTFEMGNKLAAGSLYDISAEIKALDDWSKRDDALALCEFAVERDIYAQRMYEWRDKYPLYKETLHKAQLRIASRQRKMLNANTYNYGLFMREIGFHDKFLNAFEDDEKNKDAKRAKAIEEVKVEELKANMSMFMAMLKEMQPTQAASSGTLNSADSNMSSEA